jgi:hypothetical protein
MAVTKSNTLRIASASGSVTDRRHGLAELARTEDVQFIVGDWMSEYNMTTRGGAKVKGNQQSSEFETSFMESIEPALECLAKRKTKVAVNAGASDTKKLHDVLVTVIENKGLNLSVAWIEGDEVFDQLQQAIKAGEEFTNLTTGKHNSLAYHFGYASSKTNLIQAKSYLTGSSIQSMHSATLAHGELSRP